MAMNNHDMQDDVTSNVKEFYNDFYKSSKSDLAIRKVAVGNRDLERKKHFNHLFQNLKGKKILDIGCGPNPFLLRFYDINVYEYHYTCLDLSDTALALIPDHDRITKIQGNVLCLPFENDAFDYVCAFGVLMYVKNHERAVQEIFRVLKKTGTYFGYESIMHKSIFKKTASVHTFSKMNELDFKNEVKIYADISFFKKNYSPFRALVYKVTAPLFNKTRLLPLVTIFFDNLFINTIGKISKRFDGRAIFFSCIKKINFIFIGSALSL